MKHGASRRGAQSPEFRVWQQMISRCERPSARSFPLYGGRGIRVCEEWRHDFAAFLAHVGPRPSDGHSIDRINNDGNYEPGNCRWATAREQSANKRNTTRITAFGETLTVTEWSERTGIPRVTIASRIAKGMRGERALAVGDLRTKGRHAPRVTPHGFIYSQARTRAA